MPSSALGFETQAAIVGTMHLGSRTLLAVVLAAIWLTFSVSPAAAASARKKKSEETHETEEESPGHTMHVGCNRVVSEVDSETGSEPGRSPDLSVLAKRLGTSVTWVERCLQSYGRRSKRPGYESAEGREKRLELMEREEVEETFAEDDEEPGAIDRVIHPEKERQFKLKAMPTPSFWEKESGESEDQQEK